MSLKETATVIYSGSKAALKSVRCVQEQMIFVMVSFTKVQPSVCQKQEINNYYGLKNMVFVTKNLSTL